MCRYYYYLRRLKRLARGAIKETIAACGHHYCSRKVPLGVTGDLQCCFVESRPGMARKGSMPGTAWERELL